MKLLAPGVSKLGRKYHYRPHPANHPLLKVALLHPPHDGTPLPDSVDLRSLACPVRDQGSEGACSGFSTAAFREICCAVWGGGKEPLGGYLSPAYLYARTRMAEGSSPSDAGATVADELAVLSSYGVCPETFLPYNQDPSEAPTPACDVAALPYRCGTPCMVHADNPDNLKAVLVSQKPVIIGFTVYESFESVGKDGIVPMPDTRQENVLGGHAVLVCGYKQISGALYWIVRNSWSASWGDGGYCYQPAEYAQFWSEAWTTFSSSPGE